MTQTTISQDPITSNAQLAVDIGATKTAFAVYAPDGCCRHQHIERTASSEWQAFLAMFDCGLAAIRSQGVDVSEIGVSVAGTIDPLTGNVNCANVPSITGRDLARDLGTHTGCTVRIRNDAECFALAEAHNGTGNGYDSVFAVILGSGIGGAIVANGQLLGGATGQVGEWGHGNDVSPLVEKYGLRHRECGCGRRNCLDLFGAGLGMANIHEDLFGRTASAKDILAAVQKDEPDAARTVSVFVDIVSSQLAQAINVLDPHIVPVAGGLSRDAKLIAELDSATRARSLGRLERPLIVPATHNEFGCLYGASLLGTGLHG